MLNTLGGPTVLGCVKGNYSDTIQGIFENCATNEADHVAYIQSVLGMYRLLYHTAQRNCESTSVSLDKQCSAEVHFEVHHACTPGICCIVHINGVCQ